MEKAMTTSDLKTVPARRGRACRLNAGQAIKIINTHGHQVVDTWAFSAEDLREFMSVEHTRPTIETIFPTRGHKLYTNRRRPILDNCTDNLGAAMRQIGLTPPEVPSPLNLWMNIPVGPNGSTTFAEPVSRPGDYVVLRAVMDCIIAMSACPQDILPINKGKPVEVHHQILS
jgi:uncharacterized protein